ncbi:hypothetical protein C1N97_13575 [Enterobacter hormaechei]|nr:hypothetical protein C1N97_13575 [Enterobacter hormaechei]
MAVFIATVRLQSYQKWWSWRELNPRPKFLQSFTMLVKTNIYINNHHVALQRRTEVCTGSNVEWTKCGS